MARKLGTMLAGGAVLALAAAGLAACNGTEYTVTFVSGDETVAIATAQEGGTVYSANVSTAEGVRFDGWYESETASEPFDFSTAITQNITLYARFTSLEYSVTYHLGGATGTAPEQVSVNADGTFTVSDSVPRRHGYEFLGWTDGTATYAGGDTYTVDGASDVTLVALWRYSTVDITFLGADGSVEEVRTVPYGSDVAAPQAAPFLYAFAFAGWDAPEGAFTTVTQDATYTPLFSYAPTQERYFDFTLNADGKSYSVAARDVYDLPAQIALPAEYNGLPVTQVATGGFSNAYGLSDVYIPSSYRMLGGEAFYSSSVERVYVEEGLQIIGACAFQELNSDSLTIEIPASLEEIHDGAFVGAHPAFEIAAGANFRYDGSGKLLLTADGTQLLHVSQDVVDLVVPASVTHIAPAACMPGGWDGNMTLQSVTIEGQLEEIGGGAFHECYKLTSLTFAEGAYVKKIYGAEADNIVDGVETPCTGAFFNCDLRTITFPSGLEYIGAATFFRNPRLTDIVLPTTVEYISEQAFENGEYDLSNTSIWGKEDLTTGGVASISFAGNATRNDHYAIDGRSIIRLGGGVNEGDKLIFFCGASEGASYTVPQGVTSMSPFCFFHAEFLRTLVLPEGLTEIPYGFAMSSKIESVNIPASVTSFSTVLASDEGTEEGTWGNVSMWGGYGAFCGCTSLETITFASGCKLTTIPENTFLSIGATSLTIPASVTTIEGFSIAGEKLQNILVEEGNAAYKSVDGVLYSADGTKLILYPAGKTQTSYTVADDTQIIGSGAFNICYSLETVIFPEGVTTIEANAFNSCYYVEYDETTWEPITSTERGLKYVELPSTLTLIGDYAFAGCNLLQKVTFKGETPPTLEIGDFSELSIFGYSDWDTGASVLFDDLKFEVPEAAFRDYYLAFYAYNPNYIEGFTVPDSAKVTYTFDAKGGTAIDPVQDVMLTQMPVPEKAGAHFWGWYAADGSASGEWGELITFPYMAESNTTLYARWESERKQDGTNDLWAYDVTAEERTLTLTLGQTVWFVFTPETDCYFLFADFPAGNWYDYSVIDVSAGEYVYYERLGFRLEAGKTYYILFTCYGGETEAESWEYSFLPVFTDEAGNALATEAVLPSAENE